MPDRTLSKCAYGPPNKRQQGGMPPNQQTTTRRNAANKAEYHPDTSGYHPDTTRIPADTTRIPPGYQRIPPGYHPDTSGYRPDTTGQPPTRQNTTRRNAAKPTNHNKAECRQTNKNRGENNFAKTDAQTQKNWYIGVQLKKQRFYIKNTRIRSWASNFCSLRKSFEFQTFWT